MTVVCETGDVKNRLNMGKERLPARGSKGNQHNLQENAVGGLSFRADSYMPDVK